MVHWYLRFITRLRLLFFSKGTIEIVITKMGTQPILEHNGNRNRILNRRCEWTPRVCRKNANAAEIEQLSVFLVSAFLVPANEVVGRSCFYTCLWAILFRGGVCVTGGMHNGEGGLVGGCVAGGCGNGGHAWQGEWGGHAYRRDGHWIGRYASYWNVFLLF